VEPQRVSGTVNELSRQYPLWPAQVPSIVFILLQGMDLITTLAAFSHGGIELNPVVNSLMPWTGRLVAVLASKAILISLLPLLSQRKRILQFANILYTIVVAWNLAIVFALM